MATQKQRVSYRSRVVRVNKLGLPSTLEHQNHRQGQRNIDLVAWFLNRFKSEAPDQLASGEVDGDNDKDDKERMRLHRRHEIMRREERCHAVCQC